jgi:hypothetical protein
MKTHSLNLAPYQQQAAAEGRLGMVCVAMKEQPIRDKNNVWTLKIGKDIYIWNTTAWTLGLVKDAILKHCPYASGDVLVGREAWGKVKYSNGETEIIYRSDYDKGDEWHEFRQQHLISHGQSFKLLSASKMPHEYARHRYTITEVQPLWLPEISEGDAQRCGWLFQNHKLDQVYDPRYMTKAKDWLKDQWQAHHKASFESWVWKIEISCII